MSQTSRCVPPSCQSRRCSVLQVQMRRHEESFHRLIPPWLTAKIGCQKKANCCTTIIQNVSFGSLLQVLCISKGEGIGTLIKQEANIYRIFLAGFVSFTILFFAPAESIAKTGTRLFELSN